MSIVGPNSDDNKIIGILPDPINNQDAVTKRYCDINSLTAQADCLSITGTNFLQANINMDNHKIINLSNPTNNQDAATKIYVDRECLSLSLLIQELENRINNN